MWHAGPETSRSCSLCQKQLWVKRLRCACLLTMCLHWSNIRWQVINVPAVDKFPLQKGNIYYEIKRYRMVKGKAENQPVLRWEDRWGDLVLHALCCNVLVCTPTTNGLGWAAESRFSDNSVSSSLPRWFCNMLRGPEFKNKIKIPLLALLLFLVFFNEAGSHDEGDYFVSQIGEVEANWEQISRESSSPISWLKDEAYSALHSHADMSP